MRELTTLSDAELLKRMAAGDEPAFVALYRRRQGPVYRFALQMGGSASVAEEVTQEVFLALIREAAQYDPARGSVAAYLYGIARNQVLRRFEQDRSYVSIADEGREENAALPDGFISPDDPLAELTRHERIESVRRAVLSLPASYREVVVLCDLHEMSYAEAAGVLGSPVGTVRSRLHRGRALLLEKLRARGSPARCCI